MKRSVQYREFQKLLKFSNIINLCELIRDYANGRSESLGILFPQNKSHKEILEAVIFCFKEVINNWEHDRVKIVNNNPKAPCYANDDFDNCVLELVKISLRIALAEKERHEAYLEKKLKEKELKEKQANESINIIFANHNIINDTNEEAI